MSVMKNNRKFQGGVGSARKRNIFLNDILMLICKSMFIILILACFEMYLGKIDFFFWVGEFC